MLPEIRANGGFYLLGISKSRVVELFGRSQRVEHYFASLPERRLAVVGKHYRYKVSTANLKDWGVPPYPQSIRITLEGASAPERASRPPSSRFIPN